MKFYATLLLLGAAASATQMGVIAERADLPGLNATQTTNARAIIRQVKADKVGKHGCQTVITYGLTFSDLLIYANKAVPKSLKYHHDAIGDDHDSLGIYQQRATFYPDIEADMDAAKSTHQLITRMKTIQNWENIPVPKLCEEMVAQGLYQFGEHFLTAKKVCAADGF